MNALTAGNHLGPYVLEKAIGSGATAQVFRAHHEDSHQVVALKLMAAEGSASQARFHSEVASLRAVSHPGVVDVYDAGQDGPWMWLAMELVQGRSLNDWIARLSGTTRMRHILLAGVEVADALAAVHDHGLLHRDLKPANILMLPSGRVKLVDFGFAGHVDEQATGVLAGTLRYMSPERLAGSSSDLRSDLFSLGVVLFELLSRRPPHMGADRNRLILIQCTEPAPSIAEFSPQVPEDAVDIIDRCLAKPPSERPSSARQVASALRCALDSEPRPAPWRPRLHTSGLIGHKTLLDNLTQAALSTIPATVMLHGPAGVGLTRVLQEVQGRALIRGAQPVLVSGGRRLVFRILNGLAGSIRPADVRRFLLGPDRDLLLAAWPELGRASEDVLSLARPPTPQDLARAIMGVLTRAASQRPLVISVDDADRADARDIALIQGSGLVLLATHRPGILPLACQRIALPPLDRAQLGALAASMVGPKTGPRLVMDHAETLAGLPGNLIGLAHGEDPEDIRRRGGAHGATLRVRPWIRAVEEAEEALGSRSPSEALSVLAEAATVTPPPSLSLRAELIRSRAALHRGDTDEARARAGAALALAATDTDRSDARLAEAAAALRGDDLPAVEHLGQSQARSAYRHQQPDLATRWLVMVARARMRGGGLQSAVQLLDTIESNPSAGPAATLGLAWTRAQLAIHRCDWSQARRQLLVARDCARTAGSRRVRGGLRSDVGLLWLMRGNINKSMGQLERAHQDLLRTEDAEMIAQVQARLAEARLIGGDVDEASRLVDDAVNSAVRSRSPVAIIESLRVYLRHSRITGDLGRLREGLGRAKDVLRQRPQDPWGAALSAQTALGLHELDDVQGAEFWLANGTRLAPEAPFQRQAVRLARVALATQQDKVQADVALQVSESCVRLGLDHLARIATGFTTARTVSTPHGGASRRLREARRQGDRYATCWLELSLEPHQEAVRHARALGFLAMTDGQTLPA